MLTAVIGLKAISLNADELLAKDEILDDDYYENVYM